MDLKDTVLQALNELVKNGGEGSGDFDHAGRPGLVGGSEPTESREKRGFKSKSERKEVKKEKNEETPLIPKVNPSEPYNPNRKNTPEIQKPAKKEDGDDFKKIFEPLINPEKQKKINDLIRVADDVSMFDSGSIEKRENERAFKELESLNISDEEKEKAKKKLIEYHENILTHLAKSPSQYKVGLAEFDKRVGLKKSQGHYEKATELKAERNGIIKEIKEKLRKEETRKENKALADVAREALKSGKMEFEHNGEIWFRTSKRAKSFIGLDKYSQPKYEKMKANNSLYKHEYIEY